MPIWLTLMITVVAVAAIFLTTPSGQKLARAAGIKTSRAGEPPREDRDFLLRVCDGDEGEVAKRLEIERRRNPAMNEAQVYRKAIRSYMNGRE